MQIRLNRTDYNSLVTRCYKAKHLGLPGMDELVGNIMDATTIVLPMFRQCSGVVVEVPDEVAEQIELVKSRSRSCPRANARDFSSVDFYTQLVCHHARRHAERHADFRVFLEDLMDNALFTPGMLTMTRLRGILADATLDENAIECVIRFLRKAHIINTSCTVLCSKAEAKRIMDRLLATPDSAYRVWASGHDSKLVYATWQELDPDKVVLTLESSDLEFAEHIVSEVLGMPDLWQACREFDPDAFRSSWEPEELLGEGPGHIFPSVDEMIG